MQQKTVVAANFLKRKLAEYERLRREIEGLRKDAEMAADADPAERLRKDQDGRYEQ